MHQGNNQLRRKRNVASMVEGNSDPLLELLVSLCRIF